MRCFVGFFGLARSLHHTSGAIRTGFYEPLDRAGIATLRAGHFNLPKTITNPRSGEFAIVPDRAESASLELDLCWIEPQDDAAIAAELAMARAFPDAFGDNYRSLANLCHQLHSLDRLWSLLELLGVADSDLVVLLRPDLLYLDSLDPAQHFAPLLDGRVDLIVPGWQGWGGLNDRFAFCTGRAARAYATRIHAFRDACVTLGTMHAESFLRLVAQTHGLRVALTDMRAVRLRANERIAANDAPMIHLPTSSPPDLSSAEAGPNSSNTLLSESAVGDRTTAPHQAHDTLSVNRPQTRPVAPTLEIRRVIIDGFPRVLPLNGTHYLAFLQTLHRKRRIDRYLEIGTQNGMSLTCATGQSVAIDPEFLLDRRIWAAKVGVHLFEMTSDEFFATHNPSDILGGTIDLAFIDGMHMSEFVLRDFLNVENYCSKDSLVVLHDVLPQNFEMSERNRRPSMRRDKALAAGWTGDVWRLVPLLRHERPDLCIQVLDCPPTGLALISGFNPRTRASPCLEELLGLLTNGEPPESAFWEYIEAQPVINSRAVF
jgi:predicted O-methyltransferase YrrM